MRGVADEAEPEGFVPVVLGNTLIRLGKNGRRKAIRYGKALPQELQAEIDELCRQAVRHYQAH